MTSGDLASARCMGCGAGLPDSARFCSSCGLKVSSTAVGPTLPPEPTSAYASTRAVPPPAAVHEAPGAADRLGSAEALAKVPLPPMRLLPGTMLSVYRIESVLGEGGMGVVYRAHDEARDRTVAIKCLHTNLSGDAQIRRRFAREARVLAALVHPNVVAVYDLVEREHILAIVMEFVEGVSL